MSSPARAQDDSVTEIDILIGESADAASGIALARRQANAGDLLAALATLERVRFAHQGDEEAWLLQASLLCRLDDAVGARVKLDQFAGRVVSDSAWAEVIAACGPVPRPSPQPAPGTGGSPRLRSDLLTGQDAVKEFAG